jgi:hypothetical protein
LNQRVVALVFLAIGLVCVLIGRILLIRAAFGISVWWGLGIFLPFGPLLFRLNYPDLAPLSKTFRLVALPCILAYFVLRPDTMSESHFDKFFKHKEVPSAPANHYGLEKPPQKAPAPSLADRRLASNREFERLNAWYAALRLKKRDLLHSDVAGNEAYTVELAQYSAALKKATDERNSLSEQKK